MSRRSNIYKAVITLKRFRGTDASQRPAYKVKMCGRHLEITTGIFSAILLLKFVDFGIPASYAMLQASLVQYLGVILALSGRIYPQDGFLDYEIEDHIEN